MRTLVFLSVALALAAGPVLAFDCPAKGGPKWREYRSDHFIVDTDLEPQTAPAPVKEFELLHTLLVKGLVGEEVEIPGHVRVIAFARPGDFAEYARRNVGGFYRLGSYGEPTIMIPASDFRDNPEPLAHELAHHLSSFIFPEQPRWFAEGLARFVENVMSPRGEVAPATGSHVVRPTRTPGGGVGVAPSWLPYALAYDARPVPVQDLFAWKGREDSSSPGRYHL